MVKSNIERSKMAERIANRMEMMWEAAILRAAAAFTAAGRERHMRAADEYARAGRAAADRATYLLQEAF